MTAHTTRVRSFSAAGDRSHRAECSCGWHGTQTTDKTRAVADADTHVLVPSRAGRVL